MGLSIGLEMAGFMLLFGATALHYRILGGVLLAAGIIPWSLPVLREAIAKERQRDAREPTQEVPSAQEPRGRRTRS
jgi:hypothetical protein